MIFKEKLSLMTVYINLIIKFNDIIFILNAYLFFIIQKKMGLSCKLIVIYHLAPLSSLLSFI